MNDLNVVARVIAAREEAELGNIVTAIKILADLEDELSAVTT